MHLNDTIVAAATPTGGAIAIVRIEGPEALVVCDKLFRADRGIQPSQAKGYKLMHGNICDGARRIDDVLVTVFRAPPFSRVAFLLPVPSDHSSPKLGEVPKAEGYVKRADRGLRECRECGSPTTIPPLT